jgi:hypothetical protein
MVAMSQSKSGESLGRGNTMPQFPFSQALTANQLGFNPLSGWQYEWTPYPCSVLLLIRSTGVSSRLTVYSGSETVQERTPIQGGGTAGTTPSELNTTPISFIAPGGDRLKLVIDEVGGLTPTVDGVAILNPL